MLSVILMCIGIWVFLGYKAIFAFILGVLWGVICE